VLAFNQDIVDGSVWLSTMGVDGKNMYYNAGFINDLPLLEIQFIIAHEFLHLAYGHLERMGYGDDEYRILEIWNIAVDYCVNRDAKSINIGKMPEWCHYKIKYEKMFAEEIYEILVKEKKIRDKNGDKNEKGKKGGDNDGTGHGEGDVDFHIDMSGNSGNPQSANITTDKNGNKRSSQQPRLSKKQSKMNIDKFNSDMINAKNSLTASQIAGNLPSDLLRTINDLTKPKINWRTFIRKFIQSHFKEDTCWTRPSRRSFDSSFHFPGTKNGKKVKIHTILDTSGSMTDNMIANLLSEIHGVVKQYPNFELTIWTFDTCVYNVKTYDTNSVAQLKNYKIRGNGGTNFMVNWDYMKENKINPDLLIVFTDGFPCSDWGIPGYCDTVYVIHSDNNENIIAPKKNGRTCHYSNKT
jgi:predicted metal-dependent peptidase